MSNPRDTRIRDQYFPGAEQLVSSRLKKGFIPVPATLRKVLPHLLPSELRIFIYLSLRANQHGMCDLSYEEMLYELRSTRKSLRRHLDSLVAKKFLSRCASGGKQYFLIHDPRVPIQFLVDDRKISAMELLEINELLLDLGQGPLKAPPPLPELPVLKMPVSETVEPTVQPIREVAVKPFNKEVEDAIAAIARQRSNHAATLPEVIESAPVTAEATELEATPAEDLNASLKRNWLGNTKAMVSGINARSLWGRVAKSEADPGTA